MSFDVSKLSHAYITGTDLVESIATTVVCNNRTAAGPCLKCIHCSKASRKIHPDIIEVGRLENKTIIGVDQIRELKRDVYVVPNDSEQKVYIVRDADTMNLNAQNAFLQILEEPPAHAVFILCTSNPAALLPTVRSRCILLRSLNIDDSTYDKEDFEALETLANEYMQAVEGNEVKLMECMFTIDKLEKLNFYSFLTITREKLSLSLRESIKNNDPKSRKAYINAETTLLKAGEMLDLNVSTGHIAGYICANLL